jgi:hypothetical protein
VEAERKMSDVYIKFEDCSDPLLKTKRFIVKNIKGLELGKIQYWPSWRRYTYQPAYPIVLDSICLGAILAKLDELNKERREAIKGLY